MRPVNNNEYSRMRLHFDEMAQNQVHFSFIVKYSRNAYYTGPGSSGTYHAEINEDFEEQGFYGQFNPGGTISREWDITQANPLQQTRTDFNAIVKVPSHFYLDGFYVWNPNAPAEAIGKRFDLQWIKGTGNVIVDGRPTIIGIKVNELYGHKPRLLSEVTYNIVDIPTEVVDGVILQLQGAAITGYSRFPVYDSGLQSALQSYVARNGSAALWQRFGLISRYASAAELRKAAQ